jgi:DNA-binding NarL/FixJ family response regulator
MNTQPLCIEKNVESLRVLAVDDEEIILNLYESALELAVDEDQRASVFDLVLCRQGDEAVDLVRAAIAKGTPFSVVFLDLRLPPGPDGVWTAEQIRKVDPYVNFVIVTGCFDLFRPMEITSRIPPEDKILYVQKPFSIHEMRQFAFSLAMKWRSEAQVRRINEELEYVNRQLMDANNALSVLARNLEKTRRESENRIITRVRTIIIPFIEKLQQDKNLQRYRADLTLLAGFIENLTSDLAADLKIAAALSPTELHIASLIKNGMSTEDIARHLNISPDTVKTHRKNIRKKLKIQDSNLNLRAYLETKLGNEEARN